jgi:hypothetical protein
MGEGCDETICIDKPTLNPNAEKINISSLTKQTLQEVIHPERPMYRTEIGRLTWKALHRMSVNYPDTPSDHEKSLMTSFFEGLALVFPCKECAADFVGGKYLIFKNNDTHMLNLKNIIIIYLHVK